jgi:hypothetical protein
MRLPASSLKPLSLTHFPGTIQYRDLDAVTRLTMNHVPARLKSSSSLYHDPRRKWVAPKDGASMNPSRDRRTYTCHGLVTRLWAKVIIAQLTSRLIVRVSRWVPRHRPCTYVGRNHAALRRATELNLSSGSRVLCQALLTALVAG